MAYERGDYETARADATRAMELAGEENRAVMARSRVVLARMARAQGDAGALASLVAAIRADADALELPELATAIDELTDNTSEN